MAKLVQGWAVECPLVDNVTLSEPRLRGAVMYLVSDLSLGTFACPILHLSIPNLSMAKGNTLRRAIPNFETGHRRICSSH